MPSLTWFTFPQSDGVQRASSSVTHRLASKSRPLDSRHRLWWRFPLYRPHFPRRKRWKGGRRKRKRSTARRSGRSMGLGYWTRESSMGLRLWKATFQVSISCSNQIVLSRSPSVLVTLTLPKAICEYILGVHKKSDLRQFSALSRLPTMNIFL